MWLRGWFHQLAGRKYIHTHHLNLSKNGGRNCPLYPSEFVVFKEMDLIMHVALTAHHTPTLMSRIVTSCISLGLYDNQ